MKVTQAIEKNEGMRGQCEKIGGSGEIGCLQYMPDTWKGASKQYLGYVARPSLINQKYVTAYMVQSWIDKGLSDYAIGLLYNGGEQKAKKGTNKYGVKYNSGAYALALVENIKNNQ